MTKRKPPRKEKSILVWKQKLRDESSEVCVRVCEGDGGRGEWSSRAKGG